MNTNNSFWLRSLISILPALSIAALHPAGSAVLRVTNDGADSSSCGSQTAPCRSISQGIENASDGDTIYVGPGRYGNVIGDRNPPLKDKVVVSDAAIIRQHHRNDNSKVQVTTAGLAKYREVSRP
jgi:hypothetical protein